MYLKSHSIMLGTVKVNRSKLLKRSLKNSVRPPTSILSSPTNSTYMKASKHLKSEMPTSNDQNVRDMQ